MRECQFNCRILTGNTVVRSVQTSWRQQTTLGLCNIQQTTVNTTACVITCYDITSKLQFMYICTTHVSAKTTTILCISSNRKELFHQLTPVDSYWRTLLTQLQLNCNRREHRPASCQSFYLLNSKLVKYDHFCSTL